MVDKEIGTLQKLVLALVVILVIAGIVFVFFPDIGDRIGIISDEVFNITSEAEKQEMGSNYAKEFLLSIDKCLSANFDGCYCNLNAGKLPSGYVLKLQNQENDLVVTLVTDKNMILASKKVEGVKLSMAMHARYAENSDIACVPQDLVITNDEGSLIVRMPGRDSQEYKFYTYADFLQIPEFFKRENEVCLITDKVEDEAVEINPAELSFLTVGKDFIQYDDRVQRIMQALDSRKVCSNEISLKNLLTWPVDVENIKAVTSCALAYEDGFGYRLQVKQDSEVFVPFAAAVVVDSCADCEEPYVLLYEVFDEEREPVFDDYGNKKYVNLTGLSSIGPEYQRKGKVSDDKISGTFVQQGQVIGLSKQSLIFKIGYDFQRFGNTATTKRFANDFICKLPILKDSIYSGEDCKIDCSEQEQEPVTLEELVAFFSRLEDGEKGSSTLEVQEDKILMGFDKGSASFGKDGVWGCGQLSILRNKIKKPQECGTSSCLCLCKKLSRSGIVGGHNVDCSSAECELFEKGFVPSFMEGGECEYGPFIEARQGVTSIDFERKRSILGLCLKGPCISS